MIPVVPHPPLTGAYRRWSTGAQLSRLPQAMAPLAFTLLTTATTGSHRLGGVMMAVFAGAEILGAVPCGRLLDRVGPARGLRLALVAAAAGLAGLASAAVLGAPTPVLVAVVVLPGLVGGGIAGGFRTLLAQTVPPAALPRAVAVDLTVVECVLVAGPVLASAMVWVHPVLPVPVMAASCLLAVLFVPRSAVERTPRPATRTALRLPVRAVLGWLATAYAIGHVLATVEVAPVPLVQRIGADPEVALVVPVVLCVASVVGGAAYAWRGLALRRSRQAQALVLLGAYAVGAGVLLVSTGWPALLAGTAVIGLATAPLGTIASTELQRAVPAERWTESFSLVFVVQGAGFVVGSLAVGILPTPAAIVLGVLAVVLAGTVLAHRPRPVRDAERLPT
ncbi:MFS transporter [Actinosynnema sp. NPDC023587]|uniref:MFS transporter n=1 Tax=Actinosynnema sp. NPDC023587 TaxID=3154695 RepID=UPI0033FA13E1